MKNHRKRKLVELVVLLVADALFFSLINPQQTYAVVIVVGYLLLVLTLYCLINFTLIVAERIVPFSLRTKKRITLAVTIVLALLLAMQSIGQLTVKDILTFIPIVLVLAFYISYNAASKHQGR